MNNKKLVFEGKYLKRIEKETDISSPSLLSTLCRDKQHNKDEGEDWSGP